MILGRDAAVNDELAHGVSLVGELFRYSHKILAKPQRSLWMSKKQEEQ